MPRRTFPKLVQLLLPALAMLVVPPPALVAQPAPEGYTPGTPWTGTRGVRERTSDIQQRDATSTKFTNHRERVHALGTIEYPERSESTVGSFTPQSDNGPQASSVNAQSIPLTFLGATLADTRAYPPDSMGAVGPTQYIVDVNGRIRSFNKLTGAPDGVLDADTDVFFASVMTPLTGSVTNNFTSDPRIRYDRLSQRWFAIMIDVPNVGTLPDRVLIAVSDSNIVTSANAWTFYQFRHDQVSPTGDTGEFADYPTLGIDANALYIGVNIFAERGRGSFDNTTAFVVRKSSVLSGGPMVVTAFRGLIGNSQHPGPYTPQGVDNYDPSATEGYVIGAGAGGQFIFFDRLVLRRISNPGGTPSISASINVPIPSTGGTIGVPALGTTLGTLDGLDFRLLGAHYRNGRLWTSGNLAVDSSGSPGGTDTRMGVRWYELQGIPTGQTPSVAQSGTLFDGSTNARCFWMGSVMVSGQGHAALGFSVAGANDRANAGTAGRMKDDAAGTMRTPLLYTATTSSYNPVDRNSSFINRWGDYSYTCLDPNDDMTMWTIQEFCNASDSYGVQIAKLLAPAPAMPLSCSPSSLAQGAANVNVTLLGTSDGDTGFFDPGAGFSNRIAAALSGSGVTVNSIIFNGPTNLTLNLTVAGVAATGARTVTVTNPDGQSATSAGGILSITSGGATTNHPPTLAAISTRTVNELTLLTFTNSASDPDGNALTYSMQNAPTNAAIGASSGVFTWTPTEAQGPSSNYLSVIVTDNGSPSLSATQSFAAIVNEVNSAPSLPAIINKTVTEGTLLTFTNTATDGDIPANALAYSLQNAPTNAAIGASSGVFTWTPTEAQGPSSNYLSVIVTDNGTPNLSATQSFTVFVLESNSPPTLTGIANRTIHAGVLLTFTNTATDPDLPANTLTYSLPAGAPAGANVTPSSGVFTWQTGDTDAGTSNNITVRVTDNGTPSLFDEKTFAVTVAARPLITAIMVSNNLVRVTWSALAGQLYRLQSKTNVADANWGDVLPDVMAIGSSATQTNSFGPGVSRYYRVMLVN